MTSSTTSIIPFSHHIYQLKISWAWVNRRPQFSKAFNQKPIQRLLTLWQWNCKFNANSLPGFSTHFCSTPSWDETTSLFGQCSHYSPMKERESSSEDQAQIHFYHCSKMNSQLQTMQNVACKVKLCFYVNHKKNIRHLLIVDSVHKHILSDCL